MHPAHTEFTHRPATAEDAAFQFQVYASTRSEELAALGWPAAQQEAFLRMQYNIRRQSYQAAYPDAERSILLAEGAPAGTAIVWRAPAEIQLVDVAFLPEFRSRGLGTRFLDRLIGEARRSALPLRLSVLRGNPAARLYERMGFVTRSTSSMYIEMEHHGADPE
jgi:ribosomal protein S18 acetylase RimI-like enzyme